MGTLKRGLAASLAVLSLAGGTIWSWAVQDGELHLDGQRGESEIWDESFYVSLLDAGSSPGVSGITYASLNYLIDGNRKSIYLYFQFLDESSEAGNGGTVQLTLADGTAVTLYTDNRAVSAEWGEVSYCSLDLGASGVCLEAELQFHTVTQAKDALESVAITLTDRAGRQTDGYVLMPVFPLDPGETVTPSSEPSTKETRETTTKKKSSRESTTKRKKTTAEKSSKDSTRRTTKRATEKEEPEVEEGRTVDYIVSDESESDYRVMTAAVCALLLILAAACTGWMIHHLLQKRRMEKAAVPNPAQSDNPDPDEHFDDGPEEPENTEDKK